MGIRGHIHGVVSDIPTAVIGSVIATATLNVAM
jgi:hypothetical protein